jgi:hypothetical protein
MIIGLEDRIEDRIERLNLKLEHRLDNIEKKLKKTNI